MLDLNVQPERSIGNEQWNFVLGMPLFQIVQILQAHCRVLKSVEVIYQSKRPLESDLVLNLTDNGIKLMFDSKNQRLKVIEIYDVSKVKLKYLTNCFNSPQNRPTPEQIDQCFGANRPGQYDSTIQAYITSFRGLTFYFSVDQQFESFFRERPHSVTPPFPPGRSPQLARMCVYSGTQLSETSAPAMPATCYQGNLYLDCAEVVFEDKKALGLRLKLVLSLNDNSGEMCTLDKTVKFGDSVQHVLSEIGSPCKMFFKSQDKMRIHSPSPQKLQETRHTDYFYNYFTLGIDILFDGKFHRVKKFLLHTNFPGHYNFNIYYRCDFNIELVEDTSSGEEQTVQVTTCTLWSEITDRLTYDVGKPVVLNRASSTNNTNPFGPTYCFGLRNMIFEVMANDHIAAVTLYAPKDRSLVTS